MKFISHALTNFSGKGKKMMVGQRFSKDERSLTAGLLLGTGGKAACRSLIV